MNKDYVFISDIRMSPQADGRVLASHSSGGNSTWQPFLKATGTITILARRGELSEGVHAGGPNINFVLVPDYNSIYGVIKNIFRIIVSIYKAGKENQIYFLRIPEPLSLLTGILCIFLRRPFVTNLVSDPSTTLTPRKMGTVLDWISKKIVDKSSAVIYVSSHLQNNYPAKSNTPTLVRSNVQIGEQDFGRARLKSSSAVTKLVLVGSNQSFGKGQDIALEALRILNGFGDFRLTFVGGGRIIEDLKNKAEEYGLSSQVQFEGEIHERSTINRILDEHDIFILPSRAEGLPRALIEAMARGLPCVASQVGGIPGVLPKSLLLKELTGESLSKSVLELKNDPDRYLQISSQLLATAREIGEAANPARLERFLELVAMRANRNIL